MTVTGPSYLHVIQRYYPFRGGSERYFQAFSERFVRTGARVQVVTTNAWDLEYFWDPSRKHIAEPCLTHEGVEILRVPVNHLPFASLTHRAIRRLMAESSRMPFPGRQLLLRAGSRFGPWIPSLDSTLETVDRPDLVNTANVAFESMIAASERFARRHAIPHIITPFLHFGEPADSRVRRYYTMPHQLDLVRRADAVMVLTEFESTYLQSVGILGDRIRVVGAGIDVESVTGGDPIAARKRLGINGPIVLTLGAAAYDKGTVHLIDAVTRLNATHPDVHLVVAGPLLAEVEHIALALSDRERRQIHVLGFISDDERRDLLAAADILALPSRTESFGLVFMEAWANGKPVIGARAGAIPYVVTDGDDGILVEFGDVAALEDAISQLITSTEDAARMGQRGRERVVSEEQWFARVRDVYASVLGTTATAVAVGS